MSLQIRIGTNTITPGLAKAAAAVKDKRPVLLAMGTQLVSLTKRAFNDSSLRAASWPNKKDGSPARLKKTGALWQSIRITSVSDKEVTVGSDRPYAAIHQLGARARKGAHGKGIPPRPFFPFLAGRMIPSAVQKIAATAMRKIQSLMPK